MSLAILGLGTALPRYPFTQKEAANVISSFFCQTDEQRRMLPILFRKAGVRQRHSVLADRPPPPSPCPLSPQSGGRGDGGEVGGGSIQTFYKPATGPTDRGPTTRQRMDVYRKESIPLAFQAARKALDQAGIAARNLTQLITVSCTGFTAPGLDVCLVKQLELSPTIPRLHVGFMGCHGVFNALQAASAMATAHAHARILICAVELSSLHLHYGWDPDSIVPHALFADGAAALVCASSRLVPASGAVDARKNTRANEITESTEQSTTSVPSVPSVASFPWQATAFGSCLFPDSEHAMTWNIGDHGFEMTLSADVPDLIARNLGPWFEPWLRRNDLQIKDVRSWAIHPGGPRILTAVRYALNLDDKDLADSQAVLAD